jgi:two-component system nitrate/nitrite response regulator NarL
MGFAPVHEATDLEELQAQGDGLPPDLVLVGSPSRIGEIEPAMQQIRAWAPDAKVVFIAPAFDAAVLVASFGAGAAGYLIENISRDGLKHSLRLVESGEKVFPSELTRELSAPLFRAADSGELMRELHATAREIEVLRCLAAGHSNQVIAAKLGVSETAVSGDIRHILRKLRVANRTQAALWAVAKGLAEPLVSTPPGDAEGGDQPPRSP